jgi:hypothetical protein
MEELVSPSPLDDFIQENLDIRGNSTEAMVHLTSRVYQAG